MTAAYDDLVFDRKSWGVWRWCLHCERAYRADTARYDGELWLCAYADCDGDAIFDQWSWAELREQHPEYPEVPEVGKLYGLYG